MLGRPRPLYIRSKVEESVAKAASAMSFTRRSGWSLGTRSPGVRRLRSVSCCFWRPRIVPSDARTDHDRVRAVELQLPFFNSLLAVGFQAMSSIFFAVWIAFAVFVAVKAYEQKQ